MQNAKRVRMIDGDAGGTNLLQLIFRITFHKSCNENHKLQAFQIFSVSGFLTVCILLLALILRCPTLVDISIGFLLICSLMLLSHAHQHDIRALAPSNCLGFFSTNETWRVSLLELGTDSYTEVVPAPQGGRLW
jgi:hypothetical protein